MEKADAGKAAMYLLLQQRKQKKLRYLEVLLKHWVVWQTLDVRKIKGSKQVTRKEFGNIPKGLLLRRNGKCSALLTLGGEKGRKT